jgi:hypothetical protein
LKQAAPGQNSGLNDYERRNAGEQVNCNEANKLDIFTGGEAGGAHNFHSRNIKQARRKGVA